MKASFKNKVYAGIAILIVAIVGHLLFAGTPIEPLAYSPPEAPAMEGPLKPNELLKQATLALKGQIQGPEDVAIGPDGLVYGGLADGRIVRFDPAQDVSDQVPEEFAQTGGRPLGLAFGPGGLYVADGIKGLLQISMEGNIRTLSTGANGTPFGFTDHLDVSSNGTVYFSDASDRFGVGEYLYDLLEAKPHGRLLKYDPQTGQTTVLRDGLYFANGVALAPDESYLLLNETYRYRVNRYWLKGPRKGEMEVVADNLPGFPDNIARSSRGSFWLCLFTVRNPVMDFLHPHPFLKKIVSRLPKFLWPKPKPYGFVLEIDGDDQYLRSFQDPSGENLKEVTGAKDDGKNLYLGSLHNDRIGILPMQ
ncbi:MAG: strictosidine synthase family protein [Leptospiraceae bacterium]|nr:strictosidine synthase family protein [Leptospiraceae bacterium]